MQLIVQPCGLRLMRKRTFSVGKIHTDATEVRRTSIRSRQNDFPTWEMWPSEECMDFLTCSLLCFLCTLPNKNTVSATHLVNLVNSEAYNAIYFHLHPNNA